MDPFAWEPEQMADQDGRTVVVTGATGGLGLVVASRLAAAGARVVAGVRDLEKAARVLPVGAGLEARLVDTASVASVTAFARQLAADGVVVDALVNNAGVSVSRFERSVDGVERTWATNVVGPVVLADAMLPVLGGPSPRVVLVGSNLSQRSSRVPDLDAVDEPERFRQLPAYIASKTAAAALAVELGERLRASGSPVRSVIAHPGIAATGMNGQAETALARVAGRIARLAARTADDGARAILWAATADDVEPGTFVGPALRRSDRRLHPVPVRGAAVDPAFRARVRAFVDQVAVRATA
ncbi:SDR family NAD(P)-dependent oxidoreductase [Curtobacterium aurantiacum]|uniref:SDR family NAD(P)-dependent oxidoreductase n=1 Tax=Curtobacterium aurantiacum TaxID=3236919 RepID=A0ABS5VB72_9MICO|nr:SDR family NAD(P)-dependent oxidoreductase [Curtobacterium flaccumfaciens]MBT1546911.1 SDR family NAD(P)-dependent oxidoreductase [Curtobacterium flaccumfaciens pv. flaccumfaciens]MBT1586206.1 SDR family NAD(P)-dependent oxidoreductase [Curtobacterium flaccumfaciens pv. flaccumfaciens]